MSLFIVQWSEAKNSPNIKVEYMRAGMKYDWAQQLSMKYDFSKKKFKYFYFLFDPGFFDPLKVIHTLILRPFCNQKWKENWTIGASLKPSWQGPDCRPVVVIVKDRAVLTVPLLQTCFCLLGKELKAKIRREQGARRKPSIFHVCVLITFVWQSWIEIKLLGRKMSIWMTLHRKETIFNCAESNNYKRISKFKNPGCL